MCAIYVTVRDTHTQMQEAFPQPGRHHITSAVLVRKVGEAQLSQVQRVSQLLVVPAVLHRKADARQSCWKNGRNKELLLVSAVNIMSKIQGIDEFMIFIVVVFLF